MSQRIYEVGTPQLKPYQGQVSLASEGHYQRRGVFAEHVRNTKC